MLDRSQLKSEGVRFARALQLVFKTASVFSGTHSTIQTPIQHSFDLLNALVKAGRQFTIGFVDNRVLINNILTSERTLQSLESEFLKRGIGAVTFEAGITMIAYKHVISVLCVQAKEIEAHGGLTTYLQSNPLEFARVFPVSKNQQRNEAGDTVLDMDSESFLMAKAMNDLRNPSLDRVDWFVQQAGMGGTQGGSEGSGEGGFGPAGPGGGGAQGAGPVAAGGLSGISSVVENYFNNSVMDSDEAPKRSYVELARIIQETRPEFVLQNFPPQRREELRKMPPEQMAAEVIEDTAVKWAAERLVKVPSGGEGLIVEEEVIRVLMRSLQANQMAGRLARKLAEYVKDLQVPQSTYARIQEELAWVVVPQPEKFRRLLAVDHYSRFEFRRLIGFITDLMKADGHEDVSALATHYFAILDSLQAPEPEELGRAVELIQAVAGVGTDFWRQTATRLGEALDRWADQPFLHQQLINAIDSLCKTLALYEDFELVESVGKHFERLAAEDPATHSRCCGRVLTQLLTPSAIDRVIEIFKQRKDDHGWMRVSLNLLRRAGNPGVARAFHHLEDETSATVRMALLRLIGRLGPTALELARERMHDPRWYVVRNACKLLTDLKDPDLLTHIVPALRHSDERVQKAAISAILDSRQPNRAGVLAASLSQLHPQVMDDVLSELMFLRDPVCVPALEHVIFVESRGAKASALCVQTLAAIAGASTELILLRVLLDTSLDPSVRRAAIPPLVRSELSSTQHTLVSFLKANPRDALSGEAQRALAAAGKA